MEYQKHEVLAPNNFLRKEFVYFSQVYQSGSISAAALRLKASQSSVSKVILGLEFELKCSLFVRKKTGTNPTPEAHDLFRKILKIQSAIAQSDIQRTQKTLTVGFHPSIGIDFLPVELIHVLNQIKDYKLSFKLQTSRENITDLVERRIDLALAANPLRNNNLVIKPLAKDGISLFGLGPDGQPQQTLIHPDQIGLVRSMRSIGETQFMEIPDYELIASMINKSNGVFNGVLPCHIARRHGLHQKSKMLHPIQICLTYRSDHDLAKIFRGYNQSVST